MRTEPLPPTVLICTRREKSLDEVLARAKLVSSCLFSKTGCTCSTRASCWSHSSWLLLAPAKGLSCSTLTPGKLPAVAQKLHFDILGQACSSQTGQCFAQDWHSATTLVQPSACNASCNTFVVHYNADTVEHGEMSCQLEKTLKQRSLCLCSTGIPGALTGA